MLTSNVEPGWSTGLTVVSVPRYDRYPMWVKPVLYSTEPLVGSMRQSDSTIRKLRIVPQKKECVPMRNLVMSSSLWILCAFFTPTQPAFAGWAFDAGFNQTDLTRSQSKCTQVDAYPAYAQEALSLGAALGYACQDYWTEHVSTDHAVSCSSPGVGVTHFWFETRKACLSERTRRGRL